MFRLTNPGLLKRFVQVNITHRETRPRLEKQPMAIAFVPETGFLRRDIFYILGRSQIGLIVVG